ncbi:hypothetical protein EO087_14005 [Dyella sp. M7H15-1]|uniref:hypothetical protein n=1 Tax=Dyella sp. M7H15-1 TaxID=2501295 RepID=UPI001005030E|nr:hypothetical protein [Dyella sp. M7H15-1]QAU24970.1 hypothetical protein EO087_14005 [Dyella sp. M7H15-1]
MLQAIQSGTPVQLWQALVQETYARTGHPLDESSESYLVFVLLRYQTDTLLLSRTQGMDWMDALSLAGTARSDALRDVGDRCLLLAGLFPGYAERSRVSVDYFITLGRSAYQGVADAARQAYAALYAQLAHSYRELVETLDTMRRLSKASEVVKTIR